MKIVVDSATPFIKGIFEPYAEVCYISGREFTPEIVSDADALVVRTRTKCDAALLSGSKVRLIATATIGYDHIDLEYCRSHNIDVTTAAGCNARGVLQWVGAALALLSRSEGWQPSQKILGVVGVGNVGRLVVEYGAMWGFEVICCDPPRALNESGFIEFEELLRRADIVSFHTPLNEESRHMLNSSNINLLKPSTAIINTSRGEVVSSRALREGTSHPILLDVWEGEPSLDPQLLERAVASTSHIAGYSLQGKANASAMVIRSVADYFGLPITEWYPDVERNAGAPIEWSELQSSIGSHFDIERESAYLKSHPEEFERIRNTYDYRKEYF